MKVNTNTQEHGKAVAAALLHELEQIDGDYDKERPLEDQNSIRLVSAYLDALRDAPENARRGFALFIGDYLATCTGGCTPYARNYRAKAYSNSDTTQPTAGAPRTIRECKAHARVWLKGGAK